jgi:hypothetical protein
MAGLVSADDASLIRPTVFIVQFCNSTDTAMELDLLYALVERLRKETIGEPAWDDTKQVFEYRKHTVEVVAVLKAVRAAHGISALEALRKSGLFIDYSVY